MLRRRILESELAPGDALPWDAYGPDQAGAPLQLRKGQAAPAAAALDALLDAGLFAGADAAPSVLHLLNDANRRLGALLHELRNRHDAERELRAIAASVADAVDLCPEIALACVFLNQIGGAHAVRHSTETAVVAVLIARAMGAPAPATLRVAAAALTMNAAMLSEHDSFQNRRTPLTREEMEHMRRHPADSVNLLKCAGVTDEQWLACVMQHHQRAASGELNRDACLIGMADRYCALVSARNYRRSLLPDEALRHVRAEARHAVDAELAEQLARSLGPYPPGCLVRLQNGETSVVTRCDERGDAIEAHALRDAAGHAIGADVAPFAARRALGAPGRAVAAALHEDQAGVRFSMRQVWGEQARL